MKKFLSALMSMTVAFGAMPVISNAGGHTLPYEKPDTLPCRVSDSGDTVIFDGDKSYDYIISTNSKFTTERNNDSIKFTPEQDGKFIVSRVWLEESIIDYSFSSEYDPETGETIYINDPIETHCHYFYPHIQNFEITYYSDTGTKIEFLGERTYYNERTVEEIKTQPSVVCYDYMEMETSDILDHSSYYAFASCHLLGNDNGAFFTYYDYGWNDEKDKSIFCIDTGYYENENGYIPVSVSGNAEITKTLYGGSYMDGNLEIATCDMVPYVLIEPTADGFAEIYSFIISPMSSTIFTIENGMFTDRCSFGCELPEAGDLNIDGYTSIADAVVFQKYLFGQINLTSIQAECADLNYDGSVDIFDMVLIRQKIIEDNHLGLIPEPIDTIQYSGEECGKNPNA
ncbi:MAG: dockerin type I repeat-containing protein [Ruminococcus sp.]|nr:dockerin type I repeat-containing protein [Ruminococcus sp.]